ncbi:30S ribosomal protein S5 [Holospora curviuscula]|uniref:Small ribosomal subunit protein uS5 n=1 Tax=Holospora curviuscula TaxID=1082868 RepID=A0A2S5R8W8_9PROT|nr:30S ribosomal protein S5 [Holospora curviuscula]PPE03642.1 30S ribosomal protein S5 [Holospora curviuscula]
MRENLQKERYSSNKYKEKELMKVTVKVSRVSKVVKGGKRFNFSALVVVGDGKGRCGFGSGKAKEVASAVRKATDQASKHLIRVPLKEGRTFFHDVLGKYGAGEVCIRSAKKGKGVIAGGTMRAIFDVMGVQDVVSKTLRSGNPHNVVRATFEAFKGMETPRVVSRKRDKKLEEIYGEFLQGVEA